MPQHAPQPPIPACSPMKTVDEALREALEVVETTTGEGSFQDGIYEAASNLRALMRRLERKVAA